MIKKIAKTKYPVSNLIAQRWSPRAFDINKNVEREQILSLCEAATWAPSCFNDQPYRFLIWDKNQNEIAHKKAFECLGEWNQKWVRTAPVLICVIANTQFRKNGKPNRWGQFDSGAAANNIYLQAFDLGLAAHPMGGFDEEKVKKEFNIPDSFTPMAMIAVGYQADDESVLEESYRKDEIADRKRLPISDNFFDSEWEKGID